MTDSPKQQEVVSIPTLINYNGSSGGGDDNDDTNNNMEEQNKRTVTILSRGLHHIIAMKPPSVICHHSSVWAGSRKKKLNAGEEPEIPMLQRVRDAVESIDSKNNIIIDNENEIDDDGNRDLKFKCNQSDEDNHNQGMMRRVNLVHRLDRGASGALLLAFADEDEDNNKEGDDDLFADNNDIGKQNQEKIKQNDEMNLANNDKCCNNDNGHSRDEDKTVKRKKKGATAALQEEMSKPTSTKTYVALVRGEGILRGENLKQKGWFEVNRPIKDEKGKLNDATTSFLFVACQRPKDENDENNKIMQPRMSLVLARPHHGRWHQIRRHLNGLSHHILGDRSHGCSKTNKEWKQKRNLPGERVFLHLARLQIPPTKFTPDGIDCACPLPNDMLNVLNIYAPDILKEALPILEKEGILVNSERNYTVGTYTIPDVLLEKMSKIKIKNVKSKGNSGNNSGMEEEHGT
jgi:23S rRNA-/tRNA-specific pseudouridylate synthase